MNFQILVASAAVVVAVLAAAAGLRSLLSRRDQVVERLERAVSYPTGGGDLAGALDDGRAPTGTARSVARLLRPLSWLARPGKSDELNQLRQSLVRAGFRGEHAMEIFLGVKLALTPLVAITFLTVNASLPRPLELPLDAAVATILAALAYVLPSIWLGSKTKERQTAIERTLPDAMDLLVTCVEAGLGLDSAIARVGEEMRLASPVLFEELSQTSREIQAGVSRADAFRRLAERTGVEDLRALSAMLIQTDMFGTSIGRALRVHSEGMRVRRMQRAEEKAAMLSVKMTIPLVLCILPALLAIVMGPAVATIVRNFSNQ